MKRLSLNTRLRDRNPVKTTCAPLIRPQFLASVKNAFEARAALAGGADILDCKDPAQGALGAVSSAIIKEIMAARSGLVVSATLGDLPNEPGNVVAAARETAAIGVHVIKCGFFESAGAKDVIRALGQSNLGQAKLAAVLMADRDPDFDLLPHLADGGFDIVMLDTADKSNGGLRKVLPEPRLVAFLKQARAAGLTAGLAGSLSIEDVVPLIQLQPGILGFRGALCSHGRTGSLDTEKVRVVASAFDSVTLRASNAPASFRLRSGQ